MQEAYIITRGSGQLIVGELIFSVQTGDTACIPAHTRHKLINTSVGSLEHLVLAIPPFDPKDVYLDKKWQDPNVTPVPFPQPLVSDCFDGAKIVAYELNSIISVAFGWVINDKSRHKPAHYHKNTTEFIFVIEGNGLLQLDLATHVLRPGDLIHVEPEEFHALRNYQEQHMVVACICSPCFSMDDVYYE